MVHPHRCVPPCSAHAWVLTFVQRTRRSSSKLSAHKPLPKMHSARVAGARAAAGVADVEAVVAHADEVGAEAVAGVAGAVGVVTATRSRVTRLREARKPAKSASAPLSQEVLLTRVCAARTRRQPSSRRRR